MSSFGAPSTGFGSTAMPFGQGFGMGTTTPASGFGPSDVNVNSGVFTKYPLENNKQ